MAEVWFCIMILGIDAGGTKTSYVVMDEKGQVVYQTVRPSMHFMKVGYEGITAQLSGVSSTLELEGIDTKTVHVALGMAGYGNDATIRYNIEQAVWKVFPNAKIVSDAHMAYYASLGNQEGVFVISGTGSIALYQHKDTFSRKGGFGFQLDDGGSAYWIGKHILGIFVKQVDQRLERTPLYDFLMDAYELTDGYEIIRMVANANEDHRNFMANVSQLTAQLEDPYLRVIYQDAAKELAQLANSFEVPNNTPLSIGGSVLLNNEIIQTHFKQLLKPEYIFVSPKSFVEYGAYFLFTKQVL